MEKRTRKYRNSKSLIELLKENEDKIAETELKLNSLKAERKELQAARKQELINELVHKAEEQGMSLEEAIELISKSNTDKTKTA